jgi:cephalosporin-C deacetylase-like acetyl esterase
MHIFALGESMGAGIALQSAEVDSRIEAVEAEALFASLRQRTPERSATNPWNSSVAYWHFLPTRRKKYKPLIALLIFFLNIYRPGVWLIFIRRS